jgi:hypothetical protein
MRNAIKILVRKLNEENQFNNPIHKYENNVEMDLKESVLIDS